MEHNLERVGADARPPQMRQGRERLTASRPYIEAALASLAIDPEYIPSARRFGNRLASDAERWQLGRFNIERGRISKSDAGRMLAQALAKLPQAGAAGVLANTRREAVQ